MVPAEKFDEEGNVVSIGDILFLNKTLGTGAFASVRLARRVKPKHEGDHVDVDESSSDESVSCGSSSSKGLDENKCLVAVKIFNKSLLKRMRTMERNATTRKVQVRTALESVEREVALMKAMRHPNIVSLLEVIDSENTDSLYMVLEYMPRGEIMSYIEGEGLFRRIDVPGTPVLKGVVDGHFDEATAALYFVDILHGLAYLHRNGVCHRDLKPENILLGKDGQVKISDFGVSHFFENEKDSVGPKRSTKCAEESQPPDFDSSSGQHLSRMDTDSALSMKGLSHCGMLTKTEGTWCFWSPEMCSINSAPFSGYAADMWAAGICLFAFVTGRLPFYSEIPSDLFDLISQSSIDFSSVNLSPHLVSLLNILMEKDPQKRAGLGDCLQHPFCAHARDIRIQKYSSDVLSSKRKLTVSDDDLRKSIKIVSLASAANVLKTATVLKKRLEETRKNLSNRSLVVHQMSLSESSSFLSVSEESNSDPNGGEIERKGDIGDGGDAFFAKQAIGEPDRRKAVSGGPYEEKKVDSACMIQ